jgi:hypothetical protein
MKASMRATSPTKLIAEKTKTAATTTGKITAEEAGTETTDQVVTVVATEIAAVVITGTLRTVKEEVPAAVTGVTVAAVVVVVGDAVVVVVVVDSTGVWMMSTTAMETEAMITIRMPFTKPRLCNCPTGGVRS